MDALLPIMGRVFMLIWIVLCAYVVFGGMASREATARDKRPSRKL